MLGNTLWPRPEVDLFDIPDHIPGEVGPQFSIYDLHEAAKAVKSMKAPAFGRIAAEALKAVGDKIAEMFLKICNAACHHETLPTYWCRNMIIWIYKIQLLLKLAFIFTPVHAQDDAPSLHIYELRSSNLDTLHLLPSNINVTQLYLHQVTMFLYHFTNIMYIVNVSTVNTVKTINCTSQQIRVLP